MTQNDVVTVTISVTSGMTDEELRDLASSLPDRFPGLVRDAERGGGSVSLSILRPRPDSSPREADPEAGQRYRDMVKRHRLR